MQVKQEETVDESEIGESTTAATVNASKRSGDELPAEPAAKRAAPYLAAHHNEIVIINVGEGDNMKTFTIHKDKLCRLSPWFRVALDNGGDLTDSAQMQVVTLNDIAPQVFELFNRFCYTGSIKDVENNELPKTSLMVRLWVFGGLIMFPKCQNNAIESLHKKGNFLFYRDYAYIYDKTDDYSPLRKWVIDTVARKMDATALEKMLKTKPRLVPNQMLVDLVLAQKNLLSRLKDNDVPKAKSYFVDEK